MPIQHEILSIWVHVSIIYVFMLVGNDFTRALINDIIMYLILNKLFISLSLSQLCLK